MARHNAETASSRSSISSLPISVAPSTIALPPIATTRAKSPVDHKSRIGSQSNETKGRKWRDSPFRNPSSVISIQMRDEDDGVLRNRKRSSRTSRNGSLLSARSSDSTTQPKRRSTRDSMLSPKIREVKKEYPLVLLHCSLLPPEMPIKAKISDMALLQALLPKEYWRRWELLNNKITSDVEIQSRGVLIPHPKADYELLEERLLESLELVKPKLRSGHYYGSENVDEVEESESEAETAIQGTKCQDCGKRVVRDITQDRVWEVKVYAANGLMRAGAWSAAWNEMEKVDIEVSMCLPEDVRRDVEERCLELGIGHDMEADRMHQYEPTDAEARRREIYGTPEPNEQEHDKFHSEPTQSYHDIHSETFIPQQQYQHETSTSHIELTQLLKNYIKFLAEDKRNVIIAFLSFTVLLFALNTSSSAGQRVGENLMPNNLSMTSLHTIPQCTMISTSAVLPLSVVQLETSTSTLKEPVSSSKCEGLLESSTTGAVDVQASFPSVTQKFAREAAFEIEQSSPRSVDSEDSASGSFTKFEVSV